MGDHALLVSLAWELSKMGLLKGIATQDELLSYERQIERMLKANGRRPLIWATTAIL